MISVQSLHKSFGKQHVLKGISFDISGGSVTGFLGANGAGKSTTMKIITGYLQADEGEVFVEQKQVLAESLETRRQIGYLPEHNPLYKDMYIKEYLRYVAGIYQLSDVENRVKRVIEQTGLGPEQKKKIRMLSKGYRQRVGLAQAIIHEPSVLILDEPTSGLDPNQIVEVRNLIQELGREKTVMLSTHIMQEVEAMCQRVLIINNGTIVKDVPVSQMESNIAGKRFYKIMFNSASFKVLLEAQSSIFIEDVLGEKQAVVSIDGDANPEIIFDFAVQNNLKLLQLSEQSASMEQLFRTSTR